MDSIMDIMHFVRPLSLKDTDKEKDETFYSLFTLSIRPSDPDYRTLTIQGA